MTGLRRPRLREVQLTSGASLQVSASVTIVVGPNNAGKSVLLSQVINELSNGPNAPRSPNDFVVGTVVEMPSADEMLRLLETRGERRPEGNYDYGSLNEHVRLLNGNSILLKRLSELCAQSSHLEELFQACVLALGTEGRGEALNSTQTPNLMIQQPRSPMQQIHESRALEAELNDLCQRAFGFAISFNRYAGADVHLHVGEPTAPEPHTGTDPGSPYYSELNTLPMLMGQGHGVKAFMGTVLQLKAANADIILIDEPEVFLHPPQARLLGEIVAEMSDERELQIIAATHSTDFIQGVLRRSTPQMDVSIARITRPTPTTNRLRRVEPNELNGLYQDRLLRYSGVMDSLFYRGAVICEGDSDCTYLSAAMEFTSIEGSLSADLHFAHCNGKHRLHRAASALVAAGVPTAVVADLDLLEEKANFRRVFESLGGAYSSVEADLGILHDALAEKTMPTKAELGQSFNAILDGMSGETLTRAEAEDVRAVTRFRSGWADVKASGAEVLTVKPSEALSRVLLACESVGLFMWRGGCLENLHPEFSRRNKPEWLRKVIEDGAFKSSAEGQDLLIKVLGFIAARQ